jgi:hypothetical protein
MFTEFLKDKAQYYQFAAKLMKFCLDHTKNPSWEQFSKKFQFPIFLPAGPIRVCHVIFRERYARLWVTMRSGRSMDDAVKLLDEIFGQDAEITPQKDGKAVGVKLLTNSGCEKLIDWLSAERVEEDIKKDFETFILRNNKSGSGKASSYIRAMALLEEMLLYQPLGFEDCQNLWSIKSISRLHELYALIREQAKIGEASVWNLPEIPSSYLQKGFCSAALKSYMEFRSLYSVKTKIFCHLALYWLLYKRELNLELNELNSHEHLFLFHGKNSELGFEKLNANGCEDPRNLSYEELLQDVRFLYEEVVPYLASLNRIAPEVASFVSSNSFTIGSDFSIYVYPYIKCIETIKSFSCSNDCETTSLVRTLQEFLDFEPGSPSAIFASPELIQFTARTALDQADRSSTVYDPACGIGTFLFCALDEIPKIEDPQLVSGSEIDPKLGSLAKIGFIVKTLSLEPFPRAGIIEDLIFRVAPNIRIEDSLKSNQRLIRELCHHWSRYDELLMYPPFSGNNGREYDFLLTEVPQDGNGLDEPFLKLDHQQFLLFCASRNIQAQQSLVILSDSIRRSERDTQVRDLMARNFPPSFVYHDPKEKKVILHFQEFRPSELRFGDIAHKNGDAGADRSSFEIKNLQVLSKEELFQSNSELLFQREGFSQEESAKVNYVQASQYLHYQIDKYNKLLSDSDQIHNAIENSQEEYQPERKLGEYLSGGLGWLDLSGSSLKGLDLSLMEQSKSSHTAIIEVYPHRTRLKLQKQVSLVEQLQREHITSNPPYQIYFLHSESDKIDPHYFYYWLRAQWFLQIENKLREKEVSEVQKTVDFLMKRICDLKINLPPFHLQGSIVKVLRKLFPLFKVHSWRGNMPSSRTPQAVDMIRYLLCL